MRVARRLLPLSVIAGVAATPHAGGTPVITLQQLPDHFVVGKPVTLTYVARLHGGFVGSDFVGLARVNGRSIQVERDGDYFRAAFTPTAVGATEVSLQLGLRRDVGNGEGGAVPRVAIGPTSRLLPIETIPADGSPPVISSYEQGRRLFVAKGCISCHAHAAIEVKGGTAPDLTGRTYPADYIERLILDPATVLADRGPYASMPALGLSHDEIRAVSAFLRAKPH